MHQIYKKQLTRLILSIMGVFIIVISPSLALAVSAQSTAGHPSPSITTPTSHIPKNVNTNFCTNLTTTASKLTTNLSNVVSKATAAWSKQNSNLTANWQHVDQKVASFRSTNDQSRQANFTKLNSLAKTATQTAAVTTYENTITTAVSTLRTAYDNARATYRSSVMGAVTARQSTVDGQITTFQNNVNGIISTYQADCSAGTNTSNLHASFISSMQSARLTFMSLRKSDTTINSTIQQYIVTRNNAFNVAKQNFTTTANAATQTLQKAFSGRSI